jgi:hypothetical protein
VSQTTYTNRLNLGWGVFYINVIAKFKNVLSRRGKRKLEGEYGKKWYGRRPFLIHDMPPLYLISNLITCYLNFRNNTHLKFARFYFKYVFIQVENKHIIIKEE